jgi:hypothetical protein
MFSLRVGEAKIGILYAFKSDVYDNKVMIIMIFFLPFQSPNNITGKIVYLYRFALPCVKTDDATLEKTLSACVMPGRAAKRK